MWERKYRLLITCEDATSQQGEVVCFLCPVAERGTSLLCEARHRVYFRVGFITSIVNS